MPNEEGLNILARLFGVSQTAEQKKRRKKKNEAARKEADKALK